MADNKKDDNKKLVKATELPRHGNPYPPKDVIIKDPEPTIIESTIRPIRESISSFLSPITSRVNHVFETGYAHSSSALQGLSDTQKPILNGAIIVFAGILGYKIMRRRKLLFGGAAAIAASWSLYPESTKEYSQKLWYIVDNKILASDQLKSLRESTSSLPHKIVELNPIKFSAQPNETPKEN